MLNHDSLQEDIKFQYSNIIKYSTFIQYAVERDKSRLNSLKFFYS